MRRSRWLLLVGFALVLTGCSGEQVFGVTGGDAGAVEVRSYCRNVGLTDVTIRTPDGVVGMMPAEVRAQQVVVFPADALTAIDPADEVTFDADYGSSGLFGVPLTVEFGAIEPGTVIVSGVEPEFVSDEEFESRRLDCGFDTTDLVLVGLLVVGVLLAGVVVLAVPVAIVLLAIRRRRRRLGRLGVRLRLLRRL